MTAAPTLEQRLAAALPVGETKKISDMARRLRVKRATIEEIAEVGEGYDLIVAFGIHGEGFYELPRSQWEIERYE